MDKIISTLITVVVAVGASAALWVGANLVFNQARYQWQRFIALAFAILGFVAGAVLSGNRVFQGRFTPEELEDRADDTTWVEALVDWVWFPLVAAVVAGAIGWVLSGRSDRTSRLAIAGGGLGALGVLAGVFTDDDYYPSIEPVALIACLVIFAGIGAGVSVLRKKPPLHGALTGAAVGWVAGAWGAADLGEGSAAWAIVAMTVPPLLVGLRYGLTDNPTLRERGLIDQRSRAYIFLGPAVLFIFAMLVIPAIRTGYLSLLDRDSEEWVGVQNYWDTFTDDDSLDLSGWADFFTSRLFFVGLILLAVGVFLGMRGKQRTGRFTELGSASSFPLLGAFLFLCFALFTVLRGTIINNLWWVVVVVIFSTAIGLAVAVLADNVKGEKIAKSIIFMPQAISLVGASIIWRFMYQPRDSSVDQTGVMNALWVGLGRLSTGSGLPTYIFGAVATLVLVGLLVVVARALTKQEYAQAAFPGALAALVGWFVIRYWSSGVGGVVPDGDGGYDADPIFFIQNPPFNNFWLMVVFIWIQAGFAMVILSAAINAVPDELIEAARVDGATPSQTFWRVTLPQIAPTITVIVTTLIVGVMKVFDIVKVMTNGQFDTQVLANDMFNTAFNNFDRGRGAALAMLIFVAVLPVLIFNIRSLQKEA